MEIVDEENLLHFTPTKVLVGVTLDKKRPKIFSEEELKKFIIANKIHLYVQFDKLDSPSQLIKSAVIHYYYNACEFKEAEKLRDFLAQNRECPSSPNSPTKDKLAVIKEKSGQLL